jgi:hypothetical protein
MFVASGSYQWKRMRRNKRRNLSAQQDFQYERKIKQLPQDLKNKKIKV